MNRIREALILASLAVSRARADASVSDAVKLVPIVLDVAGVGSSRYTTELVLTNRGTTAASAALAYTPATALGASGGGTANTAIPAGGQLDVPDAIAWLRGHGLAIPTGSNQGGTLLVTFTGLSSSNAASVTARTTTPSGAGRTGLAYPGVDLAGALSGTSFLSGLRSTSADRTNLALANASTSAPITLRVTLRSGAGGDGRSYVVTPDVTLGPGQWTQLGRVLDAAGFTNAWARVDVLSGAGPYVAYAAINDNATNDGSYVAAVPGTPPSETLLVPVLVETPSFQSELVLTNPLGVAQTARLAYVEAASPAGGSGGTLTLSFAPYEQRILTGAIDFLRQNGVAIGPKGPTYAGALSVSFRNGAAASWGFAGARTAAPSGAGEYGLFTPAVGLSDAAVNEAWVPALAQNTASRSNLALANLGDAGDAISLRVDVYDGANGRLAGSVSPPPLAPGGWTQLNALLEPMGVAAGYAHVAKTSGRDRFVAYGVVNDGGAPGLGTSDGSYVAAEPVPPISSFSVGPDETPTYPGLPVLPDEHTTFIPPAAGSSTWLVFAANAKNASNLSGAVVLQTADLRTFSYASGYTSPVMVAPVPFSSCKAAWDPEFDLNYASPGTVLQDPTRAAGNLVMIYEAENHCPGGVWQHDFYATVGFARSSDGGKSWPAPVDAELGGTNRYPVLRNPTPEPSTPENPTEAIGNAIPSAFLEGDDLYVTYVAPGPGADGFLRVARAALGGSGTIAFSKWKDGSFSSPGLGGADDPMIAAKGCVGHQGMGQISHDDALGLYLLTFVCSGTSQGAWYYSVATSLERQSWSAPRLIDGSLFPVTSGCASDGTGTHFDGWYPSFVSSGVPAGHLALSGSVFFMNGCDRGTRSFAARTFTIGAPPHP